MPPSKLIVTRKLPPKGGFLIRGFLIKGGEIICVCIYIYIERERDIETNHNKIINL